MIVNIKACSLDEAVGLLKDDHDISEIKLLPILMDHLENSDLEGLGYIFYRIEQKPGANDNKIHTSVTDFPSKGEKKWDTKYLVVDISDNVLLSKQFTIKKDAVDAAREFSSENFIDTYVLIGKTATNFSRIQSKITYKPSLKQAEGTYVFIW